MNPIATYKDKDGDYRLPKFKEEYYAVRNLQFKRRHRRIYLLENCSVSFDFSQKNRYAVYFYDSNNALIPEFSIGNNPKLHKNIGQKEGSYAFIDDRFNVFNVCHLLLDKFPRFLEFEDFDIDKFILLREYNYYSEVADLLDIKLLGFENKSKKFSINFEKLYLSTSSFKSTKALKVGSFIHPGQNMYSYTHKFIDLLQEKVPEKESSIRRIYIDRSGGSKRNITNQCELKELLEKHGFSSIKLEELSFQDQVQLFRNAEVVVGLHGAGLTNIAFCNSEAKVIEIFPPPLCNSCFC